ncbi:MAG TPA: PucR family transcriptional regulator [Dermatophilaceae bacterium]|nr:PucR family transcriptional regulator [Dermatophilaceae bacterium]
MLGDPSLTLEPVFVADPTARVRWVATSELADPTTFLEGGELLLTTGLGAGGWHREWADYVARLRGAGVVGLGFGTGLSHPRIPAEVEAVCRAVGLTLFEVPHETTFVAISRLTARLLDEREQARARVGVAVQQRLTAAASRDDEPTLLRVLAEALGGGVAVVSATGSGGQRVARTGGQRVAGASVPEPGAVADLIHRVRPQGQRTAASATGPWGTTVVHPLGYERHPDSYVAVWTPGSFDDVSRGAVATAAALLSLVEATARVRRQTHERLVGVALDRLLEADVRAAEVLLDAAARERPASTQGSEPRSSGLPQRVRVLLASGAAARLDDARRRVTPGAGGWGAEPLSGIREGRLCLLGAPRLIQTLATELADAHAGDHSADHSGDQVYVGIGSIQALSAAGRSLETAGQALSATNPATPLVRWDELVSRGVLALVGRRSGSRFAQSLLGQIADRPELVDTLRSFLAHHGSRSAVAAELGIHRNTVRHRLATLERVLGRSLDNPAARVDAWLAVQLL